MFAIVTNIYNILYSNRVSCDRQFAIPKFAMGEYCNGSFCSAEILVCIESIANKLSN